MLLDRAPCRTYLIVPASSRKMIEKAATLDADAVIFDLEDGVAPSEKEEARRNIGELLGRLDFGDRRIGVRVNGVGTRWFLDDILALERAAVDVVTIPKTNGLDDVAAVAAILRQFGLRGRSRPLSLHLLIESAAGVQAVGKIAAASPLIEAVVFGAGDYSADTGGAMTPAGLRYARSRIAVAAAAARVAAIDYVHPAIADDEGLRMQVGEAKELGYLGKWAIHPRQLPIINQGFAPSMEELAQAKRWLAAYEEASAAGAGAISVEGTMLDEAVIAIMRRHLAAARRVGIELPANSGLERQSDGNG
ncbi:MAG TPA: CoA ester lyase [Rhodoblastus sp.]|nr:CoA ester lyase [Rhodoblastus sp.]